MKLFADPTLALMGDSSFSEFRKVRYPYNFSSHDICLCHSRLLHTCVCIPVWWQVLITQVAAFCRLVPCNCPALAHMSHALTILLIMLAVHCSCQSLQEGKAGMPGRVWRTGNVQVVQNLKIIPNCLHPRNKLDDAHVDRLAELVYIPVYDSARPHGGPVAVLEALLSFNSTDSMLVANFISFVGAALSCLKVRGSSCKQHVQTHVQTYCLPQARPYNVITCLVRCCVCCFIWVPLVLDAMYGALSNSFSHLAYVVAAVVLVESTPSACAS